MLENKYTIEFFQGSSFTLNLTIKAANGSFMNLVGYNAKMQIRPSYASNTVTESLQTSNGEIVINTNTSVMTLTLPPTRTAAIAVDRNGTSKPPKTVYVYDLELIDGSGINSKILYGDVFVYGEVTRI